MSSDSCEEAAGGRPIARARNLRRNATVAEERLWYALRLLKPLGIHFPHSSQREILTVPFRRPIKPVYIRKLVRFIEAVGASHG